MYWPARYWKRSLAGSLSLTIATSGAGLSIESTRLGSLRIAKSPAPGTVRTSRTMSVSGAAWQERTSPATLLLVAERRRLVRAVDDAALEHPALARAAGAVAAAVGQADALADRGVEDRFVAVDAEGLRRSVGR